MMRVPREVRGVLQKLYDEGKKSYIVGGSVRDHFIGRVSNSDYDIATSASPEEVMGLFRRVIPTGIKHGTVTVLAGQYKVEVTTFRSETGFTDGRRPDKVHFLGDIEDDLSRRDFTMNAIAYDPIGNVLLDPFGGRNDIKARSVRSVGNPLRRFSEDGLRPLRAIRFCCQLSFTIEPNTLEAIPPSIPTFKQVSWERIRDEFEKMLVSEKPSVGLRLLEETGLMEYMLPELLPGRGCAQKGAHAFDVLDHLYASADFSPPDTMLRLAALFHDSGKPASKTDNEDGVPSFHRHERISGELAGSALHRLRFPNHVVSRVCHIIDNHMFNYEEKWTDAAVRRFVAKVGLENIEDIFALRLADAAATAGLPPDPGALEPFRRRIDGLVAADNAFSLKDLAVNGRDLSAIGVPKGPSMGMILGELLETVLDDPGQNSRDTLLSIAAKLLPKYGIRQDGD